MASELRVGSGRYRGRRLKSPETAATHPMGAREKLALFNMVNVEGAKVLDAYAGSGALGIEALSRGAEEVVFVESSAKVARTVRENLAMVEAEGAVYAEKVEKFADRAEYQAYFDVIFADPPYDRVEVKELGKLVELMREDGVLALSSPAEMGEIELPGLRISSTHTYARARVTVYRK